MQQKHTNKVKKKEGGFPCLRKDDLKCEMAFIHKESVKRHVRAKHDNHIYHCPFSKNGCTVSFEWETSIDRHVERDHGGGRKLAPCPKAEEKDCLKFFSNQGNANAHARLEYPEAVLHIVPWPKTSPNTILRDAEGNVIPGWDEIPGLVWKNDTWNCPVQDCNKWHSQPEKFFPVLFGFDHPLCGKNHHALADDKQLALMVLLFIDLCRPLDQRVMWNGNGINLGPRKRQQTIEELLLPKTKRLKF